MTWVLNKKTIILMLLSVILTVAIVMLIPKLTPQINGDNGKLPKVVIGGKIVHEGAKEGVKYFFKQPLSKRHIIQKITTKSRPKKINTVVDSRKVNISKDVADINAGFAKQLPNNRFELPNGNIYQAQSIEKGAEVFPFSGNGIYRLNSTEFKILQNYNSSGGLTTKFYQWFNPQLEKGFLTTKDLDKVLKIIPQ